MRPYDSPIRPIDLDWADRYGLLQLYVEAVEEFEAFPKPPWWHADNQSACAVGPKGRALDKAIMNLWAEHKIS